MALRQLKQGLFHTIFNMADGMRLRKFEQVQEGTQEVGGDATQQTWVTFEEIEQRVAADDQALAALDRDR